MTIDTLSRNERAMLYGLVRHPTYNDRRLSEETKLKMSTVTAIRNRLKREGYFRTVRIPYLERLGGELMVVAYTNLNVSKPREEMLRVLRDVAGGTDDIFYALADQFGLLTFSLCRNYTDAWADTERMHQLMAAKGALGPKSSRRQVAIFPINQTRFLRLFDFSRILRRKFGLGASEAEQPAGPRAEKGPPRRLSRVEMRVYHGLMKYPELVDNSIAKKIGVTRQSVTKIRRRFEGEKLMATFRIPDIKKMGAEIMSLTYFELAPTVTPSIRKKGQEWSLKQFPAFFQLAGTRDGLILALEDNFQELQKQRYEAARFFLEKGYLKENPEMTVFAVDDLTVVKELTFAPLVKKVLGMEDEKAK